LVVVARDGDNGVVVVAARCGDYEVVAAVVVFARCDDSGVVVVAVRCG
jgi:hypothetical protein